MLTLLRVELGKVFSRWRTFIGFIAIGILVPIVIVAMALEGTSYFSFATQVLRQQFDFAGNLMNGYTVAYIILGMLYIHVPFLVTLVAGDSLAGEATAGTYRLILTRPRSRSSIVLAKWLASSTYTLALVAWMGILSMGIGLPTLGTGELLVIRSSITVIAQDDVVWRFAAGLGFAALSMLTVSTLAFLLSSLVEHAIGPIMTTMAIIIVFTIVSAIDVPLFDGIRPLLFTNHMNGWKLLFDDPVDWSRVITSASVLAGHIAACLVATVVIIQRKDILT